MRVDGDRALLKIGELAKLAGKTVRAVHLYEEMALMSPARRSPGGFRLYDRENLERIQLIDRLQRLGFSLAEIRGVVQSWSTSPSAPDAMNGLETIYRAKLKETRRGIHDLKGLESELLASLSYLEGCRTCGAQEDPIAACAACERPAEEDVEDLPLITGISRH